MTDLSLKRFLIIHATEGSTLTVGIVKFKLDIPYGVVKSNGKIFESIEEKPQYFFDVGAGIYAASPEVLSFIPKERKLDFPELIKILKGEGRNVSCFEIDEYWKDIGIMKDFEEVNAEIWSWSEDRLFHVFPETADEDAS